MDYLIEVKSWICMALFTKRSTAENCKPGGVANDAEKKKIPLGLSFPHRSFRESI